MVIQLSHVFIFKKLKYKIQNPQHNIHSQRFDMFQIIINVSMHVKHIIQCNFLLELLHAHTHKIHAHEWLSLTILAVNRA